MAYGKKFRYIFESKNGSKIEIFILKKNYLGDVITRPLGRAPLLKRDSNNSIYGTSLEMYAECKVSNEYASLYTSSADEYKVELYKNNVLIWTGFVTPELYSEPDTAPPYDVQIVATDGLGELKRYPFTLEGAYSISQVLAWILEKSSLSLNLQVLSTLKGDNVDAMSVMIMPDHWYGSTCYDVLQRLLASMHAVITQHNGKWVLFRETDIRSRISNNGLQVTENGASAYLPVVSFGSLRTNEWWPIGMLSSAIEPAKKTVTLSSESHYRDPYKTWDISGAYAEYIEDEDAYKFKDASDSDIPIVLSEIRQQLKSIHDFTWSMRLSFKANLSLPDDTGKKNDTRTRPLLLSIRITDQYGAERRYVKWGDSYSWVSGDRLEEVGTVSTLTLNEGDQNIDIEIPLHASERMPLIAKDITVAIYRMDVEAGDISISDLSIVPATQYPEISIVGNILNAAREAASDVKLLFPASYAIEHTSNPQETMGSIPLLPGTMDYISAWSSVSRASMPYSQYIVEDYAESVALPRMSVTGKLNVPKGVFPLMFLRDNTHYILKNYSYDLYNDETDVSLISIPNAVLSGVEVEEKPVVSGQGSSGVSGPGSGTSPGGSSHWFQRNNELFTDKDVYIEGDLIVEGDVSAADNDETTGSGSGTGSKVTYTPTVTSGTKLGVITIDGSAKPIYAPSLPTFGELAYKDSLSKSDVGLGNVANSTYAGGTSVTLNGVSKASSIVAFFAPTSVGSDGQVLVSGGNGAPQWMNIHATIEMNELSDATIVIPNGYHTGYCRGNLQLNLRKFKPKDVGAACTIIITKTGSYTIGIPVVATSGVRYINPSTGAIATATSTIGAYYGLILVWNIENQMWDAFRI